MDHAGTAPASTAGLAVNSGDHAHDEAFDALSKSTSHIHSLLEKPPPITITVDPVALITSECITITSAMRKHARWAQSSVSAILGGGPTRTSIDLHRSASRSGSASGRKPAATRDPLRSPVVEEDDQSLANRWGLRGKKGQSVQDNPLLSAFARLRRDLAGCKDIRSVDAPSLLNPFLQVIRSSSTSAAITSLAVISVTKFLSYNLITPRSPRIAVAMHWLAAAITHCRFEASDSSADEVVLLRILKLMELVISSPEGQLLNDERVCEMMSTGLSMCCQARLSEVLRRSAEMAMVTMCQVIFTRLKSLDVEQIPVRSRSNTLSKLRANEEFKVEPQVNGNMTGSTMVEEPERSTDATGASMPSIDGAAAPSVAGRAERPDESAAEEQDLKPYSLSSIKELFRVLIDLLDPHNRQHSDNMRIMALRIIDVALEVAGPAIAEQPILAQLVQDDLCRHLFQLVRSDNMVLLNSSLRVAGLLLTTCRRVLKLQQELYLSYLVACLHPRVDIPQEPGINPALYEGVPQAPKLARPSPSQPSSGRSTPVPIKDRQKLGLEGGTRRPEAREAMVEAIGTLVRIPSFITELFVNYDCEVDRQDLCEDMIGLLSRNAFPDAATWSTTNVPPLCLDSLLSFVQFLAERLHGESAVAESPDAPRLRAQRVRKKIIKSGAAKFNDDPKAGVAYLVKQGVIENPDDPLQIAQFLKGTTHVSKKILGEFITKKSNIDLLTAFIGLFDFDGKRIDEALRELLTSFRLPGESALIERIVNVFTEKYCNSSVPEGIANQDAAFVLTYAIIMLNTDLYNPNVKGNKRMTYEDFTKNLRGVNDNKDFDPEYLQDIYDAIKENEIILPDEHDNKHAFEYAWKELLMKSRDVGQLTRCDTNEFDAEMFRATWKPIVATLCYVFMSATDDAVYSRVVAGFDQCAQIAAQYGIMDAFDRIVHSLASISTLASEIPPNTALNTEVQVDRKSIMVSELAVKFGRDFRAQLATVVLFRILAGHEAAISASWTDVVRIIRNLFINSLIRLPDFETSRLTALPPIPLQQPSQVIDRDGKMADTGLFSSLTSYLSSYAADDPPEPSEDELDNTLSTVDCVKACQIDKVLVNLLALPVKPTANLISAILSQLPEDSSPIVVVKPDRNAPPTQRPNGHRPSSLGLSYNPSVVFLYELATILTLRDEETLSVAGEKLTSALQTSIRDASNLHPVAASRLVHYLLEMLRLSSQHDFMRAPVVLHALSSFDDSVLESTAPTIVAGLGRSLSRPGALRSEILNSPDFWSILQRLHQHKTEADHVFDLLQTITSSQSGAITADNYEATVDLANDFATAGRIGTIQEQRRDFAARRGKQLKQATATQQQRTEEVEAVVARAVKAITVIYQLTSRISDLIAHSHLEHNEAWAAYWSPIFRALSAQCVNPCREVRHRAVGALQRSLLSENLVTEAMAPHNDDTTTSVPQQQNTEWTAIFTEVLFPLLFRLLKPEIYSLDPPGMPDTRLHSSTLLCKVYLRHLDQLASSGKLPEIWLKVLELLDRMMNSGVAVDDDGRGGKGEMAEAVVENLKNILLVMRGAGYLAVPDPENAKGENEQEKRDHLQQQQQQVLLWRETEKRVRRFLPGLLEETFPQLQVPPPQPRIQTRPPGQQQLQQQLQLQPGDQQHQQQEQQQNLEEGPHRPPQQSRQDGAARPRSQGHDGAGQAAARQPAVPADGEGDPGSGPK